MKYTQYFFINGKLLAETPRALTHSFDITHPPYSYAFFCRHCGEVYAKCPVVAEDGDVQPWSYWSRCCGRCAGKAAVVEGPAASIDLPWSADYTRDLPFAVLQREVELYAQFVLNNLKKEPV